MITPEAHAAQVAAWRADRDLRLRRPDGWLALVGLHWLSPGENHVGAHPANQVMLHGHDIPPRIGSLWVEDGRVRLVPHDGVDILHGGKPVGEITLEDDRNERPTLLELGSLRIHIIRRGGRFALRVRDGQAPAIRAFKGMEHFPVDLGWMVVSRFEPAEHGATIEIMDITGSVSRAPNPGAVVFERGGTTWRLDALPGGDDGSLWLIFGDLTNGSETYGGGRFLYTEALAPNGTVVVDFNLAYNPPCVFSQYATCPLPPQQNRLALRIEAGERAWHPPGAESQG
jgi:uncharacterized protein (DUF1684 family)